MKRIFVVMLVLVGLFGVVGFKNSHSVTVAEGGPPNPMVIVAEGGPPDPMLPTA